MIDGAPPLTRRRQTKTGEIYFDENEEYLSDADSFDEQLSGIAVAVLGDAALAALLA